MKFLFDLFPILLFFIAYKAFDIYVATGVAIAATIAQVTYSWVRNHRVEKMHLLTLVLIVVLGGATLWLHDKRFIMWKPTLVNWLFAVVFLGSQFIGARPLVQRMMGSAIELPDALWRRLNLSWALFFALLGAINIYVAFFYGPELAPEVRENIWVNFKLFGMMGLTILFVVAQAIFLSRYVKDDESRESS